MASIDYKGSTLALYFDFFLNVRGEKESPYLAACMLIKIILNMLFPTTELVKKAEMYFGNSRYKGRAWVPGLGIMGSDTELY